MTADTTHIPISPEQNRAARIAGLITAGTIPILFTALALVQTKIFSSSNMTENIPRLLENELLFRTGLLIDIVMYLSVAVLGWAFYVMLRPISRSYAVLGLTFRIVESVFGIIGVMAGISILILISNTDILSSFTPDQIAGYVSALREFQDTLNKMIPFFLSPGAIIFYWLFIRSRYIPRFLAISGIVAYSAVLTNAVLVQFNPGLNMAISGIFALPVVLFEFTIGLWLYFKKLRHY